MANSTIFRGRDTETLLTVSLTGLAFKNLSAPEAQHGTLIFTGTLSGDIEVRVPVTARPAISQEGDAGLRWLVVNGCTGGGVTFKPVSGDGVTVAVGETAQVYYDGSAMVAILPTLSQIGSTSENQSEVEVAAGASDTLTEAESDVGTVILDGGSGDADVVWPAETSTPGRKWVVRNVSSNTFTLLGDADAGDGVEVAPGYSVWVQIDETGSMIQLGPQWSDGTAFAQVQRQVVIQPAGNVALSTAQAQASDIELRSGGGVSALFTVDWPAAGNLEPGAEWVVTNTTGQIANLTMPGGTAVPLVNNQRKHVLFDGTELREVGRAYPINANVIVTAPTHTFTDFAEVDHDYMEFTPSGGAVTVEWPNAAALYKRGRHHILKNDHTSQNLTIKTTGAGADKTFVLLPGETADFVIDDSGAIVRQERWSRVVSVAHDDNADYTVGHPDFLAEIIEVTGTLGATRNLVLPTLSHKTWGVNNQTTQSLVVKTSGGTGPTLAAGKTQWVYGDGTDIIALGAPTA
jgi:hypothetical protein